MIRICIRCRASKSDADFGIDRKTKDGLHPACKECKRAESRRRYRDNVDPVKHRERVARWARENHERLKALNRASHQNRREKRNAESRVYRAKNLEHMRALGRAWSKNNPEKWKITNAARRAKKHSATPGWAKDELDSFIVKEMYDLAIRRTKSTGIEWHVDHIVPLKSKIVQGLHCSANLQVIPGSVNHSKGNRTWPDMP